MKAIEKIKPYKKDIILVVFVLIICFGALLIQKITSSTGRDVVIIVNGKEIERVSLDKNIEKRILFENDEKEYNILVIADKEAYIKEATCSKQVCVKHNKISKEGEAIVCLPHKLSIQIE